MVILLALNRPAVSAAQSAGAGASLAAEEREGCRRNLKVIYDAIQAYQFDHKDMPNWLSDLVPDYISDGNTLICPVCRRTGRTEQPPLADPKLACSYLFEFSPVPLVTVGPEPRPTRRDWKRRQMGLVGSVVPVVRCRHHDPLLNLAFNGTIYDSPNQWELVFTNRIRASELSVAAIFGLGGAEESPSLAINTTRPAQPTSHRSTTRHTVDLSPFYTSELTQPLQGKPGDDLGSLPKGTCALTGVDFDIRGIIQLATDSGSPAKLPSEVKGIPIHHRCQHLYFLHAACVAGAMEAGEQIGSYNVHLSKSDILLEIPIYFGRSVADWHGEKPSGDTEKELKVAWVGENGLSTQTGAHVRLFLTAWNLAPGVDIDSLDFVSAGKQASPFLVAISFD
jgi:hypothetical protein